MADTYKIESQRPRVSTGAGGQIENVMDITFTTLPSGQAGEVRIPMNAYTPEHVAEVVGALAQKIEQVQAL